MAGHDVKKIYQEIIDDVCKAVREALSQEGYDDHTLQELRTLWLSKLESSRALEPLPVSAVDQATNREFRHPHTGDTHNKQSTGVKVNHLHPVSNTAVTNLNTNYTPTINPGILSAAAATTTTTIPTATTQFIRSNFSIRPTNPTNNSMKTSNQLDGTNDEIMIKKKSSKKKIQVQLQVDGTGPPLGDDDDEDDESEVGGNDVGDELDDDDDDDGNEEGREDPNPLCSEDDVSDDDASELFDTENVVVCQYDRISRTKNKWRFILKSGVMNIVGRDYVFSKATGDADW